MDEKERILNLVSDRVITVQEGLALLEKLGPEASESAVPFPEKKKEDTVQDMIDRLVENTINDLQTVQEGEKTSDLDKIEQFAKVFDMTYSDNNFKPEPATREKLVEVAKYVTEGAIKNLLARASKSDNPEDQEGRCGTGRFVCSAWFDDNQIEVELTFAPFTAFGCSSECEVIPEIILEKYKKLHG